jgi:hypothetical protein
MSLILGFSLIFVFAAVYARKDVVPSSRRAVGHPALTGEPRPAFLLAFPRVEGINYAAHEKNPRFGVLRQYRIIFFSIKDH